MTKPRTVIMAMVTALLATALGAVPPSSAEELRTGFAVAVPGYGSGILGTLEPRANSNGNRVICVSSGLGDGQVKIGVEKNNPKLAWLLHRYVNNTSSNMYAAGLAWITKNQLDNQPAFWAKEKAAFQKSYPGSYTMTQDAITDMNGQAARKHGPYTIPLAKAVVADEPMLGEVKNVGILAAGGAWMTDADLGRWSGNSTKPANAIITLRITGGTFVSNGGTTMTVTPSSAPQTVRIKSDGVTETAEVKASVGKVLPSTNYLSLSPVKAGYQMMVTPVTALSSTTSETIKFTFQRKPVLSSKVATAYVPLGGTLTDTVSVARGKPGSKIAVSAKVYGPLSAQPSTPGAAPKDAPVFQEFQATQVTLDAAGFGEVSFTSEKTPATGWFVWQERADGGDGNLAADSTFGRPEETTLVQQPKVTTRAQQAKVQVGEQIADDVTIEGMGSVVGGVDSLTRSGTITVLGPLPAPRGQPEGGECAAIPAAEWARLKPAKTWPFTESQDQTYLGLGQYTVTKSGCYAFTAELSGENKAGETVYHVTHKPGDAGYANQMVLADVEEGLWSQVGASIVALADTATDVLTDEIVLVGREDLDEAFIGARVYGPFRSRPSQEAEPGPAPVDSTMLHTTVKPVRVKVDSDGSAKVTLSMPRPTEPGIYVWQEYAASAVEPETTGETQSVFGMPSETVLVAALPSVRSTVSAQSGEIGRLGDTLSDTIELAGVDQFLAFSADARVEISGQLWGPAPVTDGPCEHADWTDAPVASSYTKAVSGDGPIPGLGAVVATKPGCYAAVATITGWNGSVRVWELVHEPGSDGYVDQTIRVVAPEMITQVNLQAAEVGQAVIDTISVTRFPEAGAPTGTRIVASLHGPLAPADGDGCDTITAKLWTDAIEADENGLLADYPQTIQVAGNGDVQTAPVVLRRPGCYTWTEDLWLPSDPEKPVGSTPPGEVAETTLVASPEVLTRTSHQLARPGAAIMDTIRVTRLDEGLPAVIDATLHGPYPVKDGQLCVDLTEADWDRAIADEVAHSDTDRITDVRSGEYRTKPVEVFQAGCYTWVETLRVGLDPDEPDFVVKTPPGLAVETTLVRDGEGIGIKGGVPGVPGRTPVGPSSFAVPAMLARSRFVRGTDDE